MIGETVIRTAVVVPLKIARGAIEFGLGLLPGSRDAASTDSRTFDVEAPQPPAPPEHVETEVDLVAEASDWGPGPEIHVDEPWEGYRRMKVDEIVAHLEGQSAEVLAAIELYETTHRHRGAVLNAVRSASRG